MTDDRHVRDAEHRHEQADKRAKDQGEEGYEQRVLDAVDERRRDIVSE
jgi:hypothetical protein